MIPYSIQGFESTLAESRDPRRQCQCAEGTGGATPRVAGWRLSVRRAGSVPLEPLSYVMRERADARPFPPAVLQVRNSSDPSSGESAQTGV
jgi:hypothetical protein